MTGRPPPAPDQRARRPVGEHRPGLEHDGRVATRCCSPPESPPRGMPAQIGEAEPLGAARPGPRRWRVTCRSTLRSASVTLPSASCADKDRRWKDHADALAGIVDLGPRFEHLDAVYHRGPAEGSSSRSGGAAGRLARARRPDDNTARGSATPEVHAFSTWTRRNAVERTARRRSGYSCPT